MTTDTSYLDTTYIVLLNWNGWRDSVTCLESLLGLTGAKARIVVCDNGSEDGSLGALQEWAEGRLAAQDPGHERLARLLARSPGQATPWRLLDRRAVEQGTAAAALTPLSIIANNANLGFAAGNNVGIRYALQQDDCSHVWLLNNDTLVEPDALTNMLARLHAEPQPAVCGSRLMFVDDPSVIQALGGNRYNPWTGNASASLGRYLPEAASYDSAALEQQLDYICGASLLLPRRFLEEVGLMQEDYFLYYEEVDWMTRNNGRFKQLLAADAVVYHKEGSSIGSASLHTRPSPLSEFYMLRSKLRFTWRHFPWCFPTCYLASWGQALNRLRRGHFASAGLFVQVLLGRSQCPR